MARKFTFRGKTIEELRSIPIADFTAFLKARARRAVRRASVRYKKLLEKINAARRLKAEGKEKVVRTHARDAVILPDWVGLKFAVHNGKEFKPVEIKEEMIGRRLGEFSHSTGRVIHSGPGVGATRGSKFIPLK
ncbi:MAG: 30S ribosomal protein S19 [Candidatus Micrarchaeia archaeon]